MATGDSVLTIGNRVTLRRQEPERRFWYVDGTKPLVQGALGFYRQGPLLVAVYLFVGDDTEPTYTFRSPKELGPNHIIAEYIG